MHPYWIVVERKLFPGRTGIGITARSEAHALALLTKAYGSAYRVISIKIIEDMRELDQKHVIPNMGNWFKLGIWYPRGREYISD
jgi:hypothetical protein